MATGMVRTRALTSGPWITRQHTVIKTWCKDTSSLLSVESQEGQHIKDQFIMRKMWSPC